jgi:hypothetical protein
MKTKQLPKVKKPYRPEANTDPVTAKEYTRREFTLPVMQLIYGIPVAEG